MRFAGYEVKLVGQPIEISNGDNSLRLFRYGGGHDYTSGLVLSKETLPVGVHFLYRPYNEQVKAPVDSYEASGLVVRVFGPNIAGGESGGLRLSAWGVFRADLVDAFGLFPSRVAIAAGQTEFGGVIAGREKTVEGLFLEDVAALPLPRNQRGEGGGVFFCCNSQATDQAFLDLAARRLGVGG